MKAALEVRDLIVSYRDSPVLWNIDATFPMGSIIGIIGPNGSGKSTFLKAAMGLIDIQKGSVRYFGSKRVEEVRGQIAYLPQRESVDWDFPIHALDLVLMGSYARVGLGRRAPSEEYARARECLDRVGMLAFEKRQISELSGGQQQRIFLARALMTQAEIYLLDEPFSAVDVPTEEKILQVIRELKQQGKTIVLVHHDLHSVAAYADWVMLLNTRMVAFAPTAEVMRPELLHQAFGPQIAGLAAALFEWQRKERRP